MVCVGEVSVVCVVCAGVCECGSVVVQERHEKQVVSAVENGANAKLGLGALFSITKIGKPAPNMERFFLGFLLLHLFTKFQNKHNSC